MPSPPTDPARSTTARPMVRSWPAQADAEIILTNKTVLSRDVIDRLPRVKMIGVLATGVNVVDVEAAKPAASSSRTCLNTARRAWPRPSSRCSMELSAQDGPPRSHRACRPLGRLRGLLLLGWRLGGDRGPHARHRGPWSDRRRRSPAWAGPSTCRFSPTAARAGGRSPQGASMSISIACLAKATSSACIARSRPRRRG